MQSTISNLTEEQQSKINQIQLLLQIKYGSSVGISNYIDTNFYRIWQKDNITNKRQWISFPFVNPVKAWEDALSI